MPDTPQPKIPAPTQPPGAGGADEAEALGMLAPGCPPDPERPGDPNRQYSLHGRPQVEPEAGYWTIGPNPLPCIVPVQEVLRLTSDPRSEFYVPPYPRDPAVLDWEIKELDHLEGLRDRPGALAGTFCEPAPPAQLLTLFGFPSTPAGCAEFTRRDPVSDFIQLDLPPFGTIFNIGTREQFKIEDINQQHLRRQSCGHINLPLVVQTGRQLARMFQDETPGLIHRNALDYLLYKRLEISPPRQARIWMALDITIYSALLAAWHYKWAADPSSHSYRQRPYEYDRNRSFRVLYDDVVDDLGVGSKCPRPAPCPSPGTPRHPAYPSGHSTYSAAASEILAYFFPSERPQLEQLANNIGTARLWAGVHWHSDHTAGQRIGRAVATLVRRQLEGDCVPRVNETLDTPPPHDQLRQQATDRRNGRCAERQDELPTQSCTHFDDCGRPTAQF